LIKRYNRCLKSGLEKKKIYIKVSDKPLFQLQGYYPSADEVAFVDEAGKISK